MFVTLVESLVVITFPIYSVSHVYDTELKSLCVSDSYCDCSPLPTGSSPIPLLRSGPFVLRKELLPSYVVVVVSVGLFSTRSL